MDKIFRFNIQTKIKKNNLKIAIMNFMNFSIKNQLQKIKTNPLNL